MLCKRASTKKDCEKIAKFAMECSGAIYDCWTGFGRREVKAEDLYREITEGPLVLYYCEDKGKVRCVIGFENRIKYWTNAIAYIIDEDFEAENKTYYWELISFMFEDALTSFPELEFLDFEAIEVYRNWDHEYFENLNLPFFSSSVHRDVPELGKIWRCHIDVKSWRAKCQP